MKDVLQQGEEDVIIEGINDLEIAAELHSVLDIDLVIYTLVRYTYKTYGGDVVIKHINTQVIDAKSGEIITAIQTRSKKESVLDSYADDIAAAILEALSEYGKR